MIPCVLDWMRGFRASPLLLGFLSFGFVGLSQFLSAEAKIVSACVELEPTTTQVLIATVYLEISPLCREGDLLVGRYEIDVPLRPKKSEGGRIELPIDESFDHYLKNGGVLTGLGFSDKEGQPNRLIECEIFPPEGNGIANQLGLVIQIGKRVLKFKTDFELRRDGLAYEPLVQIP